MGQLIFNHMVKCIDDHLDRTFAALADPTRRAVMARLARGPCRVTDLAKPFEMSLPAVSKHLRVLERAGLLEQEKDGRIRRCQLCPGPLKQANDWIRDYKQFWEGQLDSLARFLEQ